MDGNVEFSLNNPGKNIAIPDRINDLITAVYRMHTLDPWKLGRERSEYFENVFRKRMSGWPIRNQTDPEYGHATTIAFLLHPGYHMGIATRDGLEVLLNRLGGQCFMSLLEISHVGPFARVRFTLETLNGTDRRLTYAESESPFREKDNEFFEILKRVLEEEEIEILPLELLECPVPDVRLMITEAGCATIYHCLFDEE